MKSKVIISIFTFCIVFFGMHFFVDTEAPKVPQVEPQEIQVYVPPVIPPPRTTPKLTTTEITDFRSYQEVVSLLKQWEEEAPRLCEFGTYGKTKNGTDCVYLRMGTEGKPKLLIHSCIHGNERLAAACTLNIMARLLSSYAQDEEATWILDNRDIYFVPMLSPDTYLRSRYVEGVDPNRNYPCPERPNIESASPLMRIREFHHQQQFKGVISGHTFGRDFFYPRFGPRDEIRDLAREMANIANYSASPVGGSYPARNPGSRGYEIDWYYWTGAVAILCEFSDGSPGGHEMPSRKIIPEVDRTYRAYLLFMKRAPEITVTPPKGVVW